jgi:Domain of unknown function (DUF4160)
MRMPVVFRHEGFTFFFYSNEGNPLEPVHIHVRRGEGDAKFWLFPDVVVADCHGFSPSTLSALSKIIKANKNQISKAWYEHFSP